MILILWTGFAIAFISTSAFVFFNLPVSEIIKKANKEDGSRLFVLLSVLCSSCAAMFTVLLLMLSNKMQSHKTLVEVISVIGMMSSWILVHTLFTFHYAHMYYFKSKNAQSTKVLEFPNELKPDYLDFAYFSFVIGMTFQVSDVQVSDPHIRRTVLAHGILSFALNTFVVALTINLIAGLRQ
ncbi:DUF1345 domain-containing protein [Ferruginibacter albus]|uniref:DUF1345 domain-containing protein n=1 Tax=Ferruginibacter albus TaxID=2875540 RepID=UPI001CC7C864|nr:DUF1345 domain-containing protein [Ferruginibacter albus]